MNEEGKKKEKTDFSKFRLPTNSLGSPVARKVLLRVPVSQPSKQQYVRVRSDGSYHFKCAILKLEDDVRPYLILPKMASVVAQDIKQVILKLGIDRQGNIFLWPIPSAPEDASENTWNQSQRQVAEMAETSWLRLMPNQTLGCYEPMVAQGEIPEPTWPDYTLEEILEIAFGSTHQISDREHPALLKLWGLE